MDIAKIKKTSLQFNVPIIRADTEKLLQAVLKKYKPNNILEIGGGCGYSASIMRKILPEARITSIEKDEKRFNELKKVEGLHCLLGDFFDVIKEDRPVYDFVFVDGAKAQYGRYFDAVDGLLCDGGILFADDTDFVNIKTRGAKTIVKGIEDFLEKAHNKYKILMDDTVLIARKRVKKTFGLSNCDNKPELLAPAGDLEKLKAALECGADAVYFAGKEFGLRARAKNFSNNEIKEGVELVHKSGKKAYVTVNIFAKNADFDAIREYALFLQSIKADAVIVSDLGVLRVFKDNTNLDIHISTQANVVNKYTAMEYVRLGAKRIILARELRLNEIKEICEFVGDKAEIEVFIHGALCISYSGRCLLSNYMTGRDANRGECAHPCRYNYALMEEKRPNEFFPIEENGGGTFIMNSKDLCLAPHLQELVKAGVKSFKIEGRVKSILYIKNVVTVYRRLLDGEQFDYMAEFDKQIHRPFTTDIGLAQFGGGQTVV
ncbi:MAG: U32 family peptidase [Christensenellaceae bacterium]|jgi:putative protease|nr:U32 family peptidase [Christensenellaceae bacterium]